MKEIENEVIAAQLSLEKTREAVNKSGDAYKKGFVEELLFRDIPTSMAISKQLILQPKEVTAHLCNDDIEFAKRCIGAYNKLLTAISTEQLRAYTIIRNLQEDLARATGDKSVISVMPPKQLEKYTKMAAEYAANEKSVKQLSDEDIRKIIGDN